MRENPASQEKYIDDSLGQLRLLASTLKDTLVKLFIAALPGCAFAATASSGGTGPLLEALAIDAGLLVIAVALVLLRFFNKRARIIATAKEHERR